MINKKLKVKNLTLKNRVVMPPMATSAADDKGLVTDALLDYYHLRAKGGYLGLVITEHVFVLEEGKAHRAQASMASDEVIEGQRKLVDIFHKEGIPVIAQISHAGMKADVEVPYGPSETIFKDKKVLAMDEEHIQQIIEAFVRATLRVKACGYDGVEIHSAHGYLLNQFYSPLVNQREDEYGTNRIKLHLEIIQKVREALGEDYLIALRLGALDYTEGGSTIEDALAAAKAFEAAGVDLLDISGGMNGFVIPGVTTPGYFEEVCAEIKKVVNIPVISTGGYRSKEDVEKALENNHADLIGIGRPIFKDPEFIKEIVE